MTSKFLELGTLAEQSAEEFHRRYERAQFIARWFLKSYIAFLEAPTDSVKFVRLDGMLEKTKETSAIHDKVPLVFASGGWWHFAFNIKFAREPNGSFVTETNKMSIRMHDGTKFTLSHQDRQFVLDSAAEDRFGAINSFLFEATKSGMAKHYGEHPSKIGFIDTNN